MLRLIIFTLFFTSCAQTSIKVGQDGQAHYSMLDKSHVTSGIPDLVIESINDKRADITKLGEVKVGALGDLAPVVFQSDFQTDLSAMVNSLFLKKGFLVSNESKNQLNIDIESLKLWESPPRHIPERTYCQIKAKLRLYSLKEARDLWLGDVTLEVESPEAFDVTGMTNSTFHTCLDYFVSKIANDHKLQKILNYTFE